MRWWCAEPTAGAVRRVASQAARTAARNRFVLYAGTEREQDVPTAGRYELKAGETFFLQSAGGGGYGDPQKRDRDAIARDIAEGYLTPEAAKRDYGYTPA